jgi:homoserine O-acetyltransferase
MTPIAYLLAGTLALAAGLLAPIPAGADDQAPEIADLGPFSFDGGGQLDNLKMSFATHGTLNAAKDNAILVMHGYGGNRHMADHLIGPGKAFDTERFFVVTPDTLGATQTGFPHSSSPTESGLKMAFPEYSYRDMVRAARKLIREHFGIEALFAVAGISMGGEKVFHYALLPDARMKALVPIVGSASLWTSEAIFTFEQYFDILTHCAGWDGGAYEKNPQACAGSALGSLVYSYYSREWWNDRIEDLQDYRAWEEKWGAGYLDVQDARDLYFLGRAAGKTTVAQTPGYDESLKKALGAIEQPLLYAVNRQDQFLPPRDVEKEAALLPKARVAWIDSPAGHFMCCGDDPHATWMLNAVIGDFLAEVRDGTAAEAGQD